MEQSRFDLRAIAWSGLALVLIGLTALGCWRWSRAFAAAPAHAVIRVSDARLADSLKAQGGRVRHDYGSFQLVEVSEQLAHSVQNRPEVQTVRGETTLLLNAGVLDTAAPAVAARSLQMAAGNALLSDQATAAPGTARLQIVQFSGPIKPEWHASLLKAGVTIVNYVPHNAYLVYGDQASLSRLQALTAQSEFVRWHGEYLPAMKVAPNARLVRQTSNDPRENLYGIQLLDGVAENPGTLALIEALRLAPLTHQFRMGPFHNLIVALPAAALTQLAQRSDLISLTRYTVPRRLDEAQCQLVAGNQTSNGQPIVGDYLNYLAQQGLTQAQFNAANFAVNVVDSGIDSGTTTPTHFGLYTNGNLNNPSRIVYNRLVGTPSGPNSTLQGCDGHGTINAHIIGGYVPSGAPFNSFPHVDANGFRYGMGIAPFVKMGSSTIFDNSGNAFGDFTYPDFTELEARAYGDGARISSNSWGDAPDGAYNFDAQAYDYLVRDSRPTGTIYAQAGNQQNVIVFAAGNSGPTAQTVAAPGTAKNVITVGASESVRSFGAPDRCTTADSEADNANDMSIYSSRGPTADGRNKPDVVAPGSHVIGGVFQITNPPVNGQADECYAGNGVCGGTNLGMIFWPTGQQFYTSSTGTSHATPAVTGAAALVRQRFINAGLPPPSPALTKAVLMNTARYLTGTYGNDNFWSTVQGLGAVNLNNFFQLFQVATMLRHQEAVDTFTATGQVRTISGTIQNAAQPLRVTLAWTDAPGSTAAAAWVNNLDLEVVVNGQTYRGNAFNGQYSVSGGVADAKNNVESVYLPAGLTGTYTVRVIAANIAGDGVPNNSAALDQDFALVIYNNTEALQPLIQSTGASLSAESCPQFNDVIDPGETVEIEIPLVNIGRLNANNVTATLLATGGVTAPSGSQNYGTLLANNAGTVTRSFTFTASGVCGGSLTATVQLQDGATNLGTVSFPFTLGSTAPQTHNFASTTALTIPSIGGASVYPTTITVAGVPGTVSKVTVSLLGLTHAEPDDLDILLVAPDGRKLLLMSDCGGSGDLVSANLTFDDAAATALPNTATILPGTYHPTNFGIADILVAPAPVGPYPDPQNLSALNGATPNGVWSLYVYDDLTGTGGSLTGGWTLNLIVQAPLCCVSSCPLILVNPSALPNGVPGAAFQQTFTATNGVAPLTFSLTGTLPNGMDFNAGALSGVPTQAGTFPLTVRATDANGCVGKRNYSLTLNCPAVNAISPLVAPPGLPISVTGSDLATVSAVKFANNVNAAFVVASNSSLIVTVPSGAQSGPVTLVKTYCPDVLTPTVTVPPLRGALELRNAASLTLSDLASESVVAAFGNKLASTLLNAAPLNLPQSVAGTSVDILDSAGIHRLGGIYFVTPDRLNWLVPAGLADGVAQVVVYNAQGYSTGLAQIAPVAPALFAANGNGSGVVQGFAARLLAGQTTKEPLARFDVSTRRWVPLPLNLNPLAVPVTLTVLGTGFRQRTSLTNTQVILTPTNLASNPVSVNAALAQALATTPGFDELRFVVPSTLAGSGLVNVQLQVDGKLSNVVQVLFQ